MKFAALVRKHAQIVYASAGGKDDITSYWPIPEIDGKVKPKRPPRSFIRKIFADARRKENERRLLSLQSNHN